LADVGRGLGLTHERVWSLEERGLTPLTVLELRERAAAQVQR